jgi:hypothetical protein
MVHHLCMRSNYGPAIQCLRSIWPAPCGARIKPVCYDELDRFNITPGLYIFTDVELLDDASGARAAVLHAKLKSQPDIYRVWNDPARSTRRFELLERLWKEGRNGFRAHRIEQGERPAAPASMRYPVFLRDEHLHRGPLTGLLKTEAEVRKAAADLRAPGPKQNTGPLLAVEFLEYAGADGIFRKYSYVRMGNELIPKHVLFSNEWAVKQPAEGQFDFGPWLEEEWAFLRGMPHQAEITQLFDECALDYGRVDYALVNGRIQVFEMNSNPMMLQPSHFKPIPRRPVHEFFREHYLQIFERNDRGNPVPWIDKVRWRLRRPKVDDVAWRKSEGEAGTANAAEHA